MKPKRQAESQRSCLFPPSISVLIYSTDPMGSPDKTYNGKHNLTSVCDGSRPGSFKLVKEVPTT